MMRVYGRVYSELGVSTWVEVTTDANGFNDYVYVTALAQCIKLNVNESPLWADWGIPAQPSVMSQVFPDFWMALMQQRFAPKFASLVLAKIPSDTPTYNLSVLTHQGVTVNASVQVPT